MATVCGVRCCCGDHKPAVVTSVIQKLTPPAPGHQASSR
jgi:hypothetical protein